MPADEFEPETPPRSSSKAPSIAALCVELCRLDTGPLAELRRMEPDGPGTADFWKLALCHNLPTRRKADTTRAIQFVRILALLTPKGKPPRWEETVR